MMRVFLFILITLLVGCTHEKESSTASPAEDLPSPEFPIEDPFSETNLLDNIKLIDLDNKPVDLKQFAGRKIFLNFWATWCKPCIMEMPSIERARQELSDEGYVFLLASDESIGRIKRFRSTVEFELDFVRLESRFQDLGILSIPTTLIIDEQGRIAFNHIGAMEWDQPEVLSKLRNFSM